MNCWEFVLISIALGADLFSVALPLGMRPCPRRIAVRAAAVFAGMHIGMLLAGCWAGRWFCRTLEQWNAGVAAGPLNTAQNWGAILAALVLGLLGIVMIKEQLSGSAWLEGKVRPLYGKALFLLAGSVSVDALAAGLSLGMVEADSIQAAIILGLVIFAIALFGLALGRVAGRLAGQSAAAVGAVLLLVLAGRMLQQVL